MTRRDCSSSGTAGSADAGQRSRADLIACQVAEAQQHVVDCVNRAGVKSLGQQLQFGLDALDAGGVEQIAKLRLADQLAKLRLIHGQRLRAALGQRRVAVVDVVGDVVEEQRRGERRRRPRLDRGHADASGCGSGAARR